MSVEDGFSRLRAALDAAGVRFAVGGSWASTTFGEPRFTNDIDLVADVTLAKLGPFLAALGSSFYWDAEEAEASIRAGRAFNVIYMPAALKFDLFPARAYPMGLVELERAIQLGCPGLSLEPVPIVTPEDIVLAKLHWYKSGGGTSERQWRDIVGIVRAVGLDTVYLQKGAGMLGVTALLEKVLRETPGPGRI
jgi:hypothetical protein